MNQQLMQAIAAARAGKNSQAKILLARVIKDEPENVNAWFLLSSLADTEEQKIQHLQKVLELQPDHPDAAKQLAELIPQPPELEEDLLPDFSDDSLVVATENDGDSADDTNIYPPLNLEENMVDDPDEALALLEQQAEEEGEATEELPSLSKITADLEAEMDAPEFAETEESSGGSVPDDPDEAMAWLEQLAAEQGVSVDELPALDSEESAETELGFEDDFSYLEEDINKVEEVSEDAGMLTTEMESEEVEEAAATIKISEESDFVSQAEADSIPAWLAEDEDLIMADTVIAETPIEEEAEEAENLPDWLNEETPDDWVGDEDEKTAQVIWKPGDGDDSKKPVPPTVKKEAEPVKIGTTAAKDNSGFYITLLAVIALVLIAAIAYLLFTQFL